MSITRRQLLRGAAVAAAA
ncbi:MAG: twin-arginine translocation signal domain-containing protein, partial [Myxococcales bacterium]|nr:twin-arginine translocation signal domain-containing protein [Myxococcales bacterium]